MSMFDSVLCFFISNIHLFFLTCIIGYAYHWISDRRKKQSIFKNLNIPYDPPHLIYGSFNKLRYDPDLSIGVLGKWMKKYGKVFGYFAGANPNLVVGDLEMIKQILVKDYKYFINRPKLVIKANPVSDTLVGLRDERWKEIRTLLTPTFSMAKMKLMTRTINDKLDELLRIVEEKVHVNSQIEWYSIFQALTLDVISTCAFAMNSKCQRLQQKDELLTGVRNFLKNAINSIILAAIYFPLAGKSLTFVINYLAYSGRVTQIIVSHLKKAINIRRRFFNNNKNLDVLQMMIDASIDTESKEDGKKELIQNINGKKRLCLTDDEIIANAWVFLLGGFDTTSSAITFTSYLLMKNQDIQEKVYDEIISFIPVS